MGDDKACMHDGCEREATRFEADDAHWHDWIWCDEHAEGRPVEPLSDPVSRRAFPVGARVLVDGRHRAIVAAAFPEGSTSAAFPHYKVNFRGGDMNVAVAWGRVGVTS